MRLERSRADPEPQRPLLVGGAAADLIQHLALPRRQTIMLGAFCRTGRLVAGAPGPGPPRNRVAAARDGGLGILRSFKLIADTLHDDTDPFGFLNRTLDYLPRLNRHRCRRLIEE